MLVSLHILMGVLALLSGSVAFSVKKGGPLHKKSGLVFVLTMAFMALTGAFLAAVNGEKLNMVAGCLTFYLVATAFLVVHPVKRYDRLYTMMLMLAGLVLGGIGLFIGINVVNEGGGKIDGQPAQVLIVFSAIALLASLSDIRILYSGRLKAKQKLLRHIWRMGFAMFLATTSFFLGQSQVIPEAIRTIAFLVTPVLAVLILTLYWLVRVKFWGLRKASFKER